MSRRALLNLGMLAAVAVLAALLYFDPGHTPPPEKPAPLSLGDDAITHLEIAHRGQPAVVLDRTDTGWQMRQPYPVAANATMVKNVLDALRSPAEAVYPAGKVDPQQSGLAKPSLVVTINDRKLRFGGSEPVNHWQYLTTGDRVLMINALSFYKLRHTAADFVSRRLLPDDARIQQITIPSHILQKSGTGWTLTPNDPDISADAIQGLVDAWKHAQATNVDKFDPTDAPKVSGQVDIQLVSGKALEFEIIRSARWLKLARPDLGLTYELMPAQGKTLLQLLPPAKPADDGAKTP